VEALLDSGVTGLVMSLEFTRKQEFKLKKIERPIELFHPQTNGQNKQMN